MLAIDFQAAGVTEAGFEAFNGDNVFGKAYPSSEGVVTVSFAGLSTSQTVRYAFDQSTLIDSGAFDFADLYNDYYYERNNDANGRYTLRLSGLVPGRSYAVKFHAYVYRDDLRWHPDVTTLITPMGECEKPSEAVETIRIVMPLCLGTSGSVRHASQT